MWTPYTRLPKWSWKVIHVDSTESVLLDWRMSATFPTRRLPGFLQLLYYFPRKLTIQKWAILGKEVGQLLMLNKAKGSPNLVIIISRGHQFFNHSAWRLSALALLPNRRERKTGQRHINRIVHSFSQTLLTDPQGMRKRGTSTSCLCARVIETP